LPPSSAAAAARVVAVDEAGISSALTRLSAAHAPFKLALGAGLRTALFRDASGAPRVLFVTNTTPTPQLAQLDTTLFDGRVHECADVVDGSSFHATVRTLEVPTSPQSVRMLELK